MRILNFDRIFTPLELAGGEFIVALMLYYVVLYLIRNYALHHIPAVLTGWGAMTLIIYIFFFPYKYETGENGLYGITTYFRWIPFFMFMLVGAWLGWLKTSEKDNYKPSAMRDFSLMIMSLILFYGIQLAAKQRPEFAPWQIVSLLLLMGIIYYMYRWCEAPFFDRIYRKKFGRFVSIIAGLCLESYLIQFAIITDKLNSLWPLNLLIMTCVILFCAYAVRCGARFISQTFSPTDYNWPAIFKL
ncbi:MAG: hypothetical protein NC039_00815 [Muribaculaceae bacterium]|nr:hypothetical protein [Muribaculaceae bacterium]